MNQILVIDDDDFIRSNIAEILEYEGYAVLKARDGLEGVQIATENLPDLIICDVTMPQMDGYKVLMNLRDQRSTASIPFIFLTAQSDWSEIRSGMGLGADDYLIKPATNDELLTAVTTRLEKRALLDRMYQQSFDELRGNLVTMLPHEMRTPLTGILGYAELMTFSYDRLDKNAILQMAGSISEAGERLQRLIENYLMYAQLELLKHDPKRKDMFNQHQLESPGTLISKVAQAAASKLERTDDLFVDAENVLIRISTDSLKKIIEELIDNALKFSKPGNRIEVIGRSDGNVYILQISDLGRGMTAEQIKHVGAYVQFERKLYEQQGLGLGLVLAKQLAELYAGQLHIMSEPEHGTTVSVELPLVS